MDNQFNKLYNEALQNLTNKVKNQTGGILNDVSGNNLGTIILPGTLSCNIVDKKKYVIIDNFNIDTAGSQNKEWLTSGKLINKINKRDSFLYINCNDKNAKIYMIMHLLHDIIELKLAKTVLCIQQKGIDNYKMANNSDFDINNQSQYSPTDIKQTATPNIDNVFFKVYEKDGYLIYVASIIVPEDSSILLEWILNKTIYGMEVLTKALAISDNNTIFAKTKLCLLDIYAATVPVTQNVYVILNTDGTKVAKNNSNNSIIANITFANGKLYQTPQQDIIIKLSTNNTPLLGVHSGPKLIDTLFSR